MDFLHKDVQREYEHWCQIFGEDDPYQSKQTIGLKEILRAHFLIIDFFREKNHKIVSVGPRSKDLLLSAIYRQFVAFDGCEKWKTFYEKCATLLYGLIKDHPFHDANKRTAFLVSLYYLKDREKRIPSVSKKEFENLIVEIADDQLKRYAKYKDLKKKEEEPEVLFIADFIKRKTRKIDKTNYTITYSELDKAIKHYGFYLKNPRNGFIDVVHTETYRTLLGFGPEKTRVIRDTQIIFPGWKNQVGVNVVNTVRKAIGFTHENGYDSQVFFQGADPLHTLIEDYSEPLRRLADR